MLTDQIIVFSGLGAGLGFVHTLFGPDHYVPFIFMAKARNWRLQKTILITVLCGLGHVGSSILLGFAGLAIGKSLEHLKALESLRGNWAAWAFVLFGFIYMAWGIYKAYKNKPHRHFHDHPDGESHDHHHTHNEKHGHDHAPLRLASLTPWILFLIFVLGPCEPMIPTIIYPALTDRGSIGEAIIVSIVFTFVTIATMVVMVILLEKGISYIGLRKMERYTHALAGAMLLISGLGILFLGL